MLANCFLCYSAAYLNDFTKIEYKEETIKLTEDDLNLWNMLFNQDDLQLYRLNAWLFKFVKNKNQLCSRKFQIPLVISNLYLKCLDENNHRLSSYIIQQTNHSITALEDRKVSVCETIDNLDCITRDFIQKIKADVQIIGDQNEQLVLNVINYIHCFLGLRKFNIVQDRIDYCVDQKKTFLIESIASSNKERFEISAAQDLEPSSEMEQSNHVEMTFPSEANVIQTEAIIEYKTPNTIRKRPMLNGSHEVESSKQKKPRPDRIQLEDSIVMDDVSPTQVKSTSSNPTPDSAIINESSVPYSTTKVSVFEDQFKRKLNNLTKEYSNLIDVTGVKIKQENEVSTKTFRVGDNSMMVDRGNVSNNDSSDESDIIVLGPGPPKQYDVITLNENGDEIQEKSGDSGEISENKNSDEDIDDDAIKKEKQQEPEVKNLSPSVEKVIEEDEEQRKLCIYPKKWTHDMIKYFTEDVNPDQFRQRILSKY